MAVILIAESLITAYGSHWGILVAGFTYIAGLIILDSFEIISLHILSVASLENSQLQQPQDMDSSQASTFWVLVCSFCRLKRLQVYLC